MKRSIRLFTVSALAAGIAACGGGSDGTGTADPTGTVNVGLTDAPVDSAQEVNIRVDDVSLYTSDPDSQQKR